MFSRYLMIGVAVLALTACSHKDKGEMDQSGLDNGAMAADPYGADAGAGAATPGTKQDFVVNVGDRVLFETDSSDLTQQARTTLEAQAQWLGQYQNLGVSIEGHADERGTREYNLALGERRANAVKNYLVSLGVDASRVNTVSFGKERPAVEGSDESAWSQNRRGVTEIQ